MILRQFLIVTTVCLAAITSQAEIVKAGYFGGLDLVPMEGARLTQLDQEPAVVLIFAADANSVDATAQFDQWFRDPNRPRVNVYAISVGPQDTPFEVISEVLRQRGLQVPTFHLRGGNLLNGKEYRLLVLDRGGQIRREFPTLDFAAVSAELGASGAASSTAITRTVTTTQTAVSIDGGPVATPTPVPDGVVVEDVTSNEPIYYNQRYGLTIQFPPNWTYRIAKNGDGAVCKSPTGRLDLRVWATPNETATGGGAGKMTPKEYIEQFIGALGEQNNTQVSVDNRLVVEDDELRGRDYTYSYGKQLEGVGAPGPTVRYRGRIQVFEAGGVLKAAGAEAPSREFDAASNTVIEPFFLSFHPRIEKPDDAGTDGTRPAARDSAVPVPTAPPDSGSAAPPVRRSF